MAVKLNNFKKNAHSNGGVHDRGGLLTHGGGPTYPVLTDPCEQNDRHMEKYYISTNSVSGH